MKLWQICLLDSRDNVSYRIGPGGAVELSCVLIPAFLLALKGVCPPVTLYRPFLGG